MKRALRPVDGHVHVRVAAHPEDDLLTARLVDWAVADDPGVGGEQLPVPGHDLDKVRRAGLLLALEEEFEVDGRRDAARAQRVEGREYRHHAGLVVRRRARVEAPLGVY